MPVPSRKLLFVFGTRPEAIKMAPLIRAFAVQTGYEVRVAVTAQHREMLDQVLSFFGIVPDYDLNLMRPDQSLFTITADMIRQLEGVLKDFQPDLVVVQGDTTTAFTGALAAFYFRTDVAHIEAGLRSFNRYSPFPEEMNRVLTGRLSHLHFAPTPAAANNLRQEQIRGSIHVVGNTVIDALLWGLEILKGSKGEEVVRSFKDLPTDRRFVLITGHRRESFGKPFEEICRAIAETAAAFPDVEFIYPVHLNPNVRKPVMNSLGGVKNIHLLSPLDYPHFIWLMERCHVVLTDSGGLQEEAPSLGKPVLVMRDVTERMEGIEAGNARLVGTGKDSICRALSELLSDASVYERMATASNPYGDGKAAERIVSIVSDFFKNKEQSNKQ